MPIDPLTEIVTLLLPAARFSKLVDAAGPWRIRREGSGEPFCCAILDGECRVAIDDQPPIVLRAGDFALVPAMRALVSESVAPPPDGVTMTPVEVADGHFHVGTVGGRPDLRMRIGHCSFASPDAALLVSLLPQVVLVRDQPRLAMLMQMVGDETRAQRAARDLVLERLLEVILIEALRCGTATTSAPGLARGLADRRVAAALRAVHARPEQAWTVADLAAEATLSRSAFFARFNRLMGLPPMEYLQLWRMTLAKRLLSDRELDLQDVAERVGYGSAAAFSIAFARHTGQPPARYARRAARADAISAASGPG